MNIHMDPTKTKIFHITSESTKIVIPVLTSSMTTMSFAFIFNPQGKKTDAVFQIMLYGLFLENVSPSQEYNVCRVL